MNKKIMVLSLAVLTTLFGYSQQTEETKIQNLDEVVISDTRFKLKKENSGKTIIKIDAEALERHRGKTIAQIINTHSGITINGSGSNAGQPLSTFIRGGQNRQVLVLIDGIALSDPSQIENNFDLQLLTADLIESIEILKGASSTLYGNRASTAVINITLKKASKNKIQIYLSSFFGTNNSQSEKDISVAEFMSTVGLNGTFKKFNYLLNFSSKNTDGISAIKASDDNAESTSDRFSKISSYIKLGYKFNERFELTAFVNFDEYTSGYDESFGFLDAEYQTDNQQSRIGVASKFSYKQGSFQVNAAYSQNDRDFESSFPTKFESSSLVIDAFNRYTFNSNLHTIIGINHVRTEMDSFSIPFGGSGFGQDVDSEVANDNIIDPYVNLTYLSKSGLNINAGLRFNHHSQYKGHFVYSLNPSYLIKFGNNRLKLLSTYSTAYITPSLYQLFAPGFGNPELEPQEDKTIEAGLALNLNPKFEISALYFNRTQDNYIDFAILDFETFEGEYQNSSENFNVNGIEVELSYDPNTKLNVRTNYTFTERKERDLFRIPKHKGNLELAYSFDHDSNASLSYQYNSKRISPFLNDDFTSNRILASYSTVNINVGHTVMKDRLKIYAGINNIFNENYEELYRFTTLGRNYRIGFSLVF